MTYVEPKKRTIRLDDDVWAALREMGESPNRFLRRVLIEEVVKEARSRREPLLKPGELKKGREK